MFAAITLAGCTTTNNSSQKLDGYSVLEDEGKFLVDASGKTIAQLDDNFKSICKISKYKNKLVLFGKMDYGHLMGEEDFGQIVTIIEGGKVIDSFLCFYLTNPWGEKRKALQSPSGRYIVFRKFHTAFSNEAATSNFAMIYDLNKTPAQNRLEASGAICSESDDAALCGIMYAGEFLYPANNDFSGSTCSVYKTEVEDEEQYTYVLGNKWDAPKTVLQISYPKIGLNDFLIVEETKLGIKKNLLKFKNAKILDKDGNVLKYDVALEDQFYMIDFCLKGDKLTITNLENSSNVAKIIFEL